MYWPEAASAQVCRPFDVDFEFDVSSVGKRYGWRPQLISALQAHGIGVATFGSGWPGGILSDEEMDELYSRSRINIGFGGVGY